jgi:hypothetical protein
MTVCQHCKARPTREGRRLCWTCRQDPAVRALYPSGNPWVGRGEPTTEELDALIAEGLANKPSWWVSERKGRVNGVDL